MEFSGDNLTDWAEELGKSGDFIKDLQEYASHLVAGNLPVIFSPLHWSKMMGLEYVELFSILENRNNYYKQFRIRKKKGGFRYIDAPKPELYSIQNWIKCFILDQLKFPAELTSYQKGKSIIDNARPHVGKELIVKFDLRNFFESVTEDKVLGVFRMLGYNTAVSIDLAKACCIDIIPEHNRGNRKYPFACLPQGSPSSPGISNVSAAMLDYRLTAYATSRNLNYTRYADDITFSGCINRKPALGSIKQIVKEEGFLLNAAKTSYVHRSHQQLVTGLSVNEGISIPKKNRKHIHTHLHNCINFGPYANLERMEVKKRNYREWLLGNIIFIQMIHPNEGKLMRKKFNLINWI
ncbi:reverse transcriptase family protein [Pedobacter gandavensis]|uniref:reverse transcriptase family protein n=1 Tax=Pedobacter gandavensis TaxID=2679963 RepID=UPI00247869BC|nr:reverse transcriptase family protein [Pedobacter gandavensis]WGQ11862.1 reverse transcriptase family protein [Pedobacter gandavensis]